MSTEIHWLVSLKINDGQLNSFKSVMSDMVASADREAGCLAYEWNFTADEGECHIYERYADSAAVVEHFGGFGPFVDRFREACVRVSAVVIGDPTDEARAFLNGMEPTYAKTLGGFSKLIKA